MDVKGEEEMNSFATYGEDAVFEGILRRLEWLKGEKYPPQTYVEIGAFHPSVDSNVFHFYKERGWAGSVFEPNTIHNYYFETQRPRDKFYNFAVSDEQGLAEFFIFTDGDNSNTINKDFAEQKKTAQHTPVQSVREVAVITLQRVFELHQEVFDSIPFLLSIDAEGEDYNILKAYDFDECRPTFVMVEDQPALSFMPNLGLIRPLMASRGYLPVAATLLTTIYIDQKSPEFELHNKMGRFDK